VGFEFCTGLGPYGYLTRGAVLDFWKVGSLRDDLTETRQHRLVDTHKGTLLQTAHTDAHRRTQTYNDAHMYADRHRQRYRDTEIQRHKDKQKQIYFGPSNVCALPLGVTGRT
jgi:hypothetical protein